MRGISLSVMAVMAVGLVACSKKPEPDPNILACPVDVVRVVQTNQRFVDMVGEGQTSAKPVRNLEGMQRSATLVRDGESMEVGFFMTGLPKCGWLPERPSLTPLVIKDGEIVASNAEQVRSLVAQGWVMKEAKWPWHNYSFGYLPRR